MWIIYMQRTLIWMRFATKANFGSIQLLNPRPLKRYRVSLICEKSVTFVAEPTFPDGMLAKKTALGYETFKHIDFTENKPKSRYVQIKEPSKSLSPDPLQVRLFAVDVRIPKLYHAQSCCFSPKNQAEQL